jgi:N4-gp56 family major capsid protein
MPNNVNTTATISPALSSQYDRNLLERTVPDLIHDLFAERRPIKQMNSKTISIRKYLSREPAMVPLSEAVTPEGGTIDYDDVSFSLTQYGDFVYVSDQLELTNLDPTLVEFGQILSESASITIDQVRRDSFNAGTYVRRAGGVAARASIVTTISNNDLSVVKRALQSGYNKFYTKSVDAQNKYATSPTKPAWFVITHTDCTQDWEALDGWTPVEKYMGATSTYPTEIGQVSNFRVLVSPIAKLWADAGGTAVTNSLKYTTANTACDVYSSLVVTPKALCVSDLEGYGLKNIIHPRGSGGAAIPLNQYGTTGWIAFLAQGILDQTRLYRIEHGVSALS